MMFFFFFFFSSRRRHTRFDCDWSSDVCSSDLLASTGASIAEQTAIFGHRMMEALTESGVVGVRSAGAAHFMDVAWKRAFDAGQYVGPRVFAAGHFLTTTGGHFLTS